METSTTAAPPPTVVTGRAVGRQTPWASIRLVGDRTLEVTSDACNGAVGASAVVGRVVTVSVFAGERGAPTGCSSHAALQQLVLPGPLGALSVIDGAYDPAGQQLVPWTNANPASKGANLRIRYPDPGCTHVSAAAVVETPGAVTITVSVATPAARTGGTSAPCNPDDSELVKDLVLQAPLASRRLADGRCDYTPKPATCS